MGNSDDAEGGEGADGARVQRACDACRSRKIRCDRGNPCSNCRSSRLNCVTTASAQKPQRQRVHISDAYEKKIDRIEDRLFGIENVLEKLAAKLGNVDITRDLVEPLGQSKSRNSSGRSTTEVNSGTPAPFEGETTLNRQSVFARELLEHAVGSTPSMKKNTDIKDALKSLQEMVDRQGQYTNAIPAAFSQPFFNRSLAEIDATKLERPPWDAAHEVLEKASVYPTVCFAVVFPFLSMRNMRLGLKETYDNLDEASVGSRLLLFGILYNLFLEFASYPVLEQKVEAYRRHAQTSRTHMEIAMSQLDVFLPPSYENISALLIASAYAIEMCKPSLCWILNSNAAGLSQILGYHRIQTMTNDTEEERNSKIHTFWFIYLMDKTLSLRLGRAAVIQDWDMSLPYPVVDHDHERFSALVQMGNQGSSMLLYWVKLAEIHGKTYEHLFSPAAFCKSTEQRAQTASELVSAMHQIWAERGELTKLSFPGAFSDIGDIFYLSDVVVHYSTCALIQRAVSPDNVTFNEDCLKYARAALIAHQRCNKQFNVQGSEELWSGYVHWSILQAPFTPFIVIFCHAVLHTDPTDLDSLADFVHSLESCRTVSEGADKLYKMCHLFLQVAKLYFDAKNKESFSATALKGGISSAAAEDDEDENVPAQAQQRGTKRNISTRQEADFIDMRPTADPDLDPHANPIGQFDPYLSALGLMPTSAWPPPMSGNFTPQPPPSSMSGGGIGTAGSQDTFAPSQGFDVGAGGVGVGMQQGGVGVGVGMQGAVSGGNQLQDWYSGSRYLMNLMEDDVLMPDLGV